jgi:hypothetical protein
MKAAQYGARTNSSAAFVSTNSICQGQKVPILWPLIFGTGHVIHFAHTSFKWANLASHNAGVTVAIVGISNHPHKTRSLFSESETGETTLKESDNINAYLVSASNVVVEKVSKPLCGLNEMNFGLRGLSWSSSSWCWRSRIALELSAEDSFSETDRDVSRGVVNRRGFSRFFLQRCMHLVILAIAWNFVGVLHPVKAASRAGELPDPAITRPPPDRPEAGSLPGYFPCQSPKLRNLA